MKPDGTFGAAKVILNGLSDAGQHPNRSFEVGQSNRIYIFIGSTTNVAAERNPYNATIVVTNLSGLKRSIFVGGQRNTIGFDWDSSSGWDQSIDWNGGDE